MKKLLLTREGKKRVIRAALWLILCLTALTVRPAAVYAAGLKSKAAAAASIIDSNTFIEEDSYSRAAVAGGQISVEFRTMSEEDEEAMFLDECLSCMYYTDPNTQTVTATEVAVYASIPIPAAYAGGTIQIAIKNPANGKSWATPVLPVLSAAVYSVDTITYAVNKDYTVSVKSIGALGGNVSIPGSITRDNHTFPVKEILDTAFQGNGLITGITMEDSVLSMENYAFLNCNNLKSVRLSDNIRSLSQSQFIGCTSLESINIPAACTTLEDFVFSTIPLKNIMFGEGLKTIGKSAFAGCAAESLTFPKTLETISDNAFINCASLKNITFPISLKTIGENAFKNDTGLLFVYYEGSESGFRSNVTVGSGNTALEIASFVPLNSNEAYARDGLHYILNNKSYTASVVSCDNDAAKIVIPGSITYAGKEYPVTVIMENAFASCSELRTVVLPENLSVIHNNAFAGCPYLDLVEFPYGTLKWSRVTVDAENPYLNDIAVDTRYYVDEVRLNRLNKPYYGEKPDYAYIAADLIGDRETLYRIPGSMLYLEKETDGSWKKIKADDVIGEGRYRLKFQLRIDGDQGSVYKLTDNTLVTIAGEPCQFNDPCIIADGYSCRYAFSPEFTVDRSDERLRFPDDAAYDYMDWLQVNKPVPEKQLVATGGKGSSYKFSMQNAPSWLRLTENGKLSGTPTEADPGQYHVKLICQCGTASESIYIDIDAVHVKPEDRTVIHSCYFDGFFGAKYGDLWVPESITSKLTSPEGAPYGFSNLKIEQWRGNAWEEHPYNAAFTEGKYRLVIELCLYGKAYRDYRFAQEGLAVYLNDKPAAEILERIENEEYTAYRVSLAEFTVKENVDPFTFLYENSYDIKTSEGHQFLYKGEKIKNVHLVASGGTGYYSYKFIGEHPSWLKLSSEGVLSGTPDAVDRERHEVTVQCSDGETSVSIRLSVSPVIPAAADRILIDEVSLTFPQKPEYGKETTLKALFKGYSASTNLYELTPSDIALEKKEGTEWRTVSNHPDTKFIPDGGVYRYQLKFSPQNESYEVFAAEAAVKIDGREVLEIDDSLSIHLSDRDSSVTVRTTVFRIKGALDTGDVVLSKNKYTYSGKANTPGVTVTSKAGRVLVKDVDYTVSYKNNTNIGIASAVVSGKGQYSGTVTVKFTVIPAAVTNVRAVSAGYSSIKLSWKAVSGADGYYIYRSESANGTYKKIKTITDGTVVSYKNTGRTTGKNYYYYKIYAYKTSGGTVIKSGASKSVGAKAIPVAPVISKISNSGKGAIKLSWKKVSGASGYEIRRSEKKTGTYTLVKTIKSGSTVTFTNTGRAVGKTYYYKIRAYRTVSGKKVYSQYSLIRSCKVIK